MNFKVLFADIIASDLEQKGFYDQAKRLRVVATEEGCGEEIGLAPIPEPSSPMKRDLKLFAEAMKLKPLKNSSNT